MEPEWEKKAIYMASDSERQLWRLPQALQVAVEGRNFAAYAPLLPDSRQTWQVTKVKGNFNFTKQQKATINKALRDGWFMYSWDHPPGALPESCSIGCCAKAKLHIDDIDEASPEEDDKQHGKDIRLDDDLTPLKWRFVRAAFFAYFEDAQTSALLAPGAAAAIPAGGGTAGASRTLQPCQPPALPLSLTMPADHSWSGGPRPLTQVDLYSWQNARTFLEPAQQLTEEVMREHFTRTWKDWEQDAIIHDIIVGAVIELLRECNRILDVLVQRRDMPDGAQVQSWMNYVYRHMDNAYKTEPSKAP